MNEQQLRERLKALETICMESMLVHAIDTGTGEVTRAMVKGWMEASIEREITRTNKTVDQGPPW